MKERTFNAKVISANRITIRPDIIDFLELKQGDTVEVTIKRPFTPMNISAVVREPIK